MRLNKIHLCPRMFFCYLFRYPSLFCPGTEGTMPSSGTWSATLCLNPSRKPESASSSVAPWGPFFFFFSSFFSPLNQEADSSQYRVYSLKVFFPGYFSVIQKKTHRNHTEGPLPGPSSCVATLIMQFFKTIMRDNKSCSSVVHKRHRNPGTPSAFFKKKKKMALKTKRSSVCAIENKLVLLDNF